MYCASWRRNIRLMTNSRRSQSEEQLASRVRETSAAGLVSSKRSSVSAACPCAREPRLPEVDAHRLGVPDVQEPVRLGREARPIPCHPAPARSARPRLPGWPWPATERSPSRRRVCAGAWSKAYAGWRMGRRAHRSRTWRGRPRAPRARSARSCAPLGPRSAAASPARCSLVGRELAASPPAVHGLPRPSLRRDSPPPQRIPPSCRQAAAGSPRWPTQPRHRGVAESTRPQ